MASVLRRARAIAPLIVALSFLFASPLSAYSASPETKSTGSPFNNFDDESEIEANEKQINDLIAAGKYEDAAALSEQNLQAVAKVFGTKHGQYAKALNDLGWLMQSKGDYTRARKLYEQALEVEQRRLHENDPKLATVYNNLAALVTFQGDYETAEPLYQRALKIQRAALGENHPAVAATLSNLALLMYNLGKRDEALRLHEQALAILEKQLGDKHPDVATEVNNVAALYQSQGKDAEALAMYKRALAIREAALQQNDPDVAQSLTSVALLTAPTQPAEAKQLLQRALNIYTTSLGEQHPDLISPLNELGKLAWKEGHQQEATDYFLRAGQLCNRHIFNILPGLSMAEQQAFLTQQVPEELSLLLSTCRDSKSLPQAYELLFKWKGCLIEGLSKQSALRRMTEHPKLSKSARELAAIRQQLGDWYYKAGSRTPEEWQAHQQELLKRKEQIERQIASGAAGMGDIKDAVADFTLSQWAGVLHADEAVADIFRYQRIGGSSTREDWYNCVVLAPDGHCKLIELGRASDIDTAIRAWRKQVLVKNEGTEQWNALTTKLWLPILSQLPPQCKHLWLNPDSETCRLPWHIYPQSQGILVAQIDSSRELAKLRTLVSSAADTTSPTPHMVLAGGVHFGDDKDSSGYAKYPALPGTLKEADAVKTLAESKNISVRFLSGDAPTKEHILAELPDANWIHLATHGFFIDERELSPTRAPLLASGLILAKPSGSNENQILTAEELVAADLHKARMVTLSACETGLGEKVTGQGVLGLRASIMAAGARCVVMSLWKVPDEATLILMNRFYENLWTKNMPIAEALRQAQLSVKNEPYNRFKEPVNWAGWIAIGDAF